MYYTIIFLATANRLAKDHGLFWACAPMYHGSLVQRTQRQDDAGCYLPGPEFATLSYRVPPINTGRKLTDQQPSLLLTSHRSSFSSSDESSALRALAPVTFARRAYRWHTRAPRRLVPSRPVVDDSDSMWPLQLQTASKGTSLGQGEGEQTHVKDDRERRRTREKSARKRRARTQVGGSSRY